jgi:tetratricopeptide (TPR) repeat protein
MRASGAALLFLALAIVVVFGRACAGRFVDWDDRYHISLNPDLNPPTVASVAKYWRSPQQGLYIPIVFTAWAGLAMIPHPMVISADGSVLDPGIFHSTNVAGHVLVCFLVWRILRCLLPVSSKRDWAAGAGAMLFALHPLQVEPVAWISGLKDILSGVFALTALLLYILAMRNDCPGTRTKRWIFLAIATLSYGVALFAKPSTTCLPLMALVINYFFYRGSWKSNVIPNALWIAMAVAPAVITRSAQLFKLAFIPSWDLRPFVAMDAIGFYLQKLVLPIRLGIDYGRSPGPLVQNGTLLWSWFPGFVFCLALWLGRRRFPGALAPALLFLAGLAPVLGLAPFAFQNTSNVADRFVYLAMLGPALWLAQWLSRAASPRGWIITGIVITLFAALSFVQVGVWHDDLSLLTHALQVNPGSQLMMEKLGTALSTAGDFDRGDAYFREAVAKQWDAEEALVGLGSNLHKRGRVQEAATYLRRAVYLDPADADATFNYGNVLFDQHKIDEAIRQYDLSLDARPGNPQVLVNLGTALALSGRWNQSETVFRAAIRAAPRSAMAHSGLGRVLEQQGDLSEALVEYQRALETEPHLGAAFRGRARVLVKLQH